MKFCYLACKMFKNISPDLVRSGKFECPVLSGQETHMPSPVEPCQIATMVSLFFWTKIYQNGHCDVRTGSTKLLESSW